MTFKTALAALTLITALPLSFPTLAEDNVLARVNGEPIDQDMLDFYMLQKQRQLKGHAPDRHEVLKEVVDLELMIQDAEKMGLDKDPAVLQQLKFYRQNLLVNMAVRKYLEKHPVTDEDIQAAYKEMASKQSGKEYHARHILVKTREEAEQIIDQLDKGADFAELAKEKSIGPTKTRGGDLGWFSPDRMVGEFSDAVQELDKGEYTKEPVKTQFGWHVIEQVDSRKAQTPALDEVRDELVSKLRNERLNEYMDSLRKDAKVDYLDKE